jgi:uncharacterized damage-inducible protein DinB
MKMEVQDFLTAWARETSGTLALLEALPTDKYDTRAEPGGRSLGELAWHLAEVEAYVSSGISQGGFAFREKPPHLDRPRRVEELVPAFQIVHDEAVARVATLADADLDREIRHADGNLYTIRDLLWRRLLLQSVHHRGQLTVLCRIAGGVPPGLFGRTREETPPALESAPETAEQTFVDRSAQTWMRVDSLPGVTLSPLAQLVAGGSIHRARFAKGTVIPVHTHPADEYVLILSGTVKTGGRLCEPGCFWTTPAGTRQGPHVAFSDAELLTVRLGATGQFGEPT